MIASAVVLCLLPLVGCAAVPYAPGTPSACLSHLDTLDALTVHIRAAAATFGDTLQLHEAVNADHGSVLYYQSFLRALEEAIQKRVKDEGGEWDDTRFFDALGTLSNGYLTLFHVFNHHCFGCYPTCKGVDPDDVDSMVTVDAGSWKLQFSIHPDKLWALATERNGTTLSIPYNRSDKVKRILDVVKVEAEQLYLACIEGDKMRLLVRIERDEVWAASAAVYVWMETGAK